MDRFLTVKDIGDILHIGKSKAYKLCALDGFPSIKIGSQYRIKESDFDRWIDRNINNEIKI